MNLSWKEGVNFSEKGGVKGVKKERKKY